MIKYEGKTEVKEKIKEVLDEMLEDEDFTYTIQIYENRENEKIRRFMFEVVDIKESMPDFSWTLLYHISPVGRQAQFNLRRISQNRHSHVTVPILIVFGGKRRQ